MSEFRNSVRMARFALATVAYVVIWYLALHYFVQLRDDWPQWLRNVTVIATAFPFFWLVFRLYEESIKPRGNK